MTFTGLSGRGLARSFPIALLLLLCLSFLTGCGKQVVPEETGPDPMGVHVNVVGLDPELRETLADGIGDILWKESGYRPVDRPERARIAIHIEVRDLSISDTDDNYIHPSRALGNTAMGAGIGVTIGALAAGRPGALIGTAVGGVLGLGVAAAEGTPRNAWTLTGTVTFNGLTENPEPLPYINTVEGKGMDLEKAVEKLGPVIGRDILSFIRGTQQGF